jgi:hypothetical protein
VSPDTTFAQAIEIDSAQDRAAFLDTACGGETVKLRRATLGPAHPDTLGSVISLAVSYRFVGRLPDAISLQEETLRLARASLGTDHILTRRCLVNLAVDYRFVGRLPEAIALHEEALKLSKATRVRATPGRSSPWVSSRCLARPQVDLRKPSRCTKRR